jgi:hypothetical protein
MEPAFLCIGLILLVALLTLPSSSSLERDDGMSPPARRVEGLATTHAGQPAERVTLYLFGLPPGQTDNIILGDQSTIVTDKQGSFTWPVPTSLPPLNHYYITPGSIRCYALAADMGAEQFRIAVRSNWHGPPADSAARDLLRQATRSCETKWLLGGTHPIFSVVVPDTSVVLLTVRGPDGQPLGGRQVQVVPVGLRLDHKGAIVYTGQTDAEGGLHLRCFPGSLRFQVFVSGIGFGSTGAFDAVAGQLVVPLMPPLAPFANLSGTMTSTMAGPGATVSLDKIFSNKNVWYNPRATVDADGSWTLADVLPGQYRLVLTDGRGESTRLLVTVLPGEQRRDITVTPKQTALAVDTPTMPQPNAAPTVGGRVTNAAGIPVASADVYAVCYYPNALHHVATVLTAKTDAAGTYQIAGLSVSGGRTAKSVHLVAHQPGSGLAVGDAQVEQDSVSGGWRNVQKDLVLPSSHSDLTVKVLQDGKPAPDIIVALAAHRDNSLLQAMPLEAGNAEAAQALEALLSPSAPTGPDGSVRFADLTPGLWDITANRTRDLGRTFGEPAAPFNASMGVIVQAGENLSYTLSLLPPSEAVLRAVGPIDLPSGVPDMVSLATTRDRNYGTRTPVPDDAGNGFLRFYAPGLFQATARIADRSLDINSLTGPYFEGTLLVAVSAALAARNPILIPVRRIGPASIRVRLQDAQGKPLHGAVTVGDALNSFLYAASVDAQGTVVFPNMPLGKYIVTARLAGQQESAALKPGQQESAALNQPGSPLPSDAALISRLEQPLPQTVVVQGDEEISIILVKQRPGYVRLRLIGPLALTNGYRVEARLPTDDRLIDTRSVGSEYLIGPIPAGRRILRLFRYIPTLVGTKLIAGEIAVDVKPGQVLHVALTPQSTAEQELLYSSPLMGTVLMPDGKTPAWGARVALFIPEWLMPQQMARTDTEGHLTLKDFWGSSQLSPVAPPGTPSGPVLAAWLPGSNGAIIVPYQPGQDVRLVLPAAVSLQGRITVGGQSVLGMPSTFHVRAAYQGNGILNQGSGILNQVLTVDATAQADGTFTLGGLTPGTYQVQASRDNIWLSSTQTIAVGSTAPPDLALDIMPPGLPVLLMLEDRQRKPRPGQEVKIVRPDGPLTDEVWPKSLVTDAAGMLRVDGLEAGHHLVAIPKRSGKSIDFDVPAWTPSTPPVTCRIVL